MVTGWGQLCNRTFKAVKCIGLTAHDNLKSLIVIVATLLTLHHCFVAPSVEIEHVLLEVRVAAVFPCSGETERKRAWLLLVFSMRGFAKREVKRIAE
jgi:hypothetical protein